MTYILDHIFQGGGGGKCILKSNYILERIKNFFSFWFFLALKLKTFVKSGLRPLHMEVFPERKRKFQRYGTT